MQFWHFWKSFISWKVLILLTFCFNKKSKIALIPVRSRVRISPLLFLMLKNIFSTKFELLRRLGCILTGHFTWTNKRIIQQGWLCVWILAVGSNRFMRYETRLKVSFRYQKCPQNFIIFFNFFVWKPIITAVCPNFSNLYG